MTRVQNQHSASGMVMTTSSGLGIDTHSGVDLYLRPFQRAIGAVAPASSGRGRFHATVSPGLSLPVRRGRSCPHNSSGGRHEGDDAVPGASLHAGGGLW